MKNNPSNIIKPVFLNTNAKNNIGLSDFLGEKAAQTGQKTGLEAFKEIDLNIVYWPGHSYWQSEYE